jgi:hypothetical protein
MIYINPLEKQAMTVAMLACVVVDVDPKRPEFDIALSQLRTAVTLWRELVEKVRKKDGA